MSFPDLTFWVFLAIVFAAYWMIPGRQWKNILLLIAGYIFYGWVSPWLAFMLGPSGLAGFPIGIVFAAYWMIPGRQWKNILLLIAGYIFYGWVSPWLAFMLGPSGLADF